MKHKTYNTLLSGVATAVILMAGVIISNPHNVLAETLYTQPDFSVDGSYTASQTAGGYLLDGTTTPASFNGTVQYVTIRVPDPNAWSSWFSSNVNHNPASWGAIATCSVPFSTDGSGACAGTFASNSFGNVASTTIDGNYITFEVQGNFTVSPSDYLRVYIAGDTSINIQGINTGDCKFFMVGSGAGCSGTGTFDLTQPFIVLSGSGGFTPPSSGATRIISLTPENGTTTSNTVDFNLHAYIAPEDLGGLLTLYVNLRNIDQNVLLGGLFSPYDITFLDNVVATTSGDFYYSTTTILADGNYRIRASLREGLTSFLGIRFVGVDEELNNQFIVNEATFIGNISQQSFNAIQSIYGSTTATSTLALSGTCNPFSGSSSTLFFNTGFNPISCLAFLLIPDSGLILDSLTDFRDKVSTHFPLGYVTDFYQIISTSTESSLTVINATLPSALGFGANQTISLSLNGVLDDFLYATTGVYTNATASSTETLFEITNYYWEIILYIFALLYMLRRVLGSHVISHPYNDNKTNV